MEADITRPTACRRGAGQLATSRWVQHAQDEAFKRLADRLRQDAPRRWDVFLSHAGEDHATAAKFAEWLTDDFRERGRNVTVFNTSVPEMRYRERPDPRDAFSAEAMNYDEQLAEFLIENMVESTLYLLLVTPWSLAKRSQWVAYEIRVAKALADHVHRRFFFPCLAEGAEMAQLVALEDAAEFSAVDVSSRSGLDFLARCLDATLRSS
jgi:TIR domain